MKRLAIAAAALTLVGPLAATAAYADQPGQYNGHGYGDNNRGDQNNYRNDNSAGHSPRANRSENDNRGQSNGRWNGQPQNSWQNQNGWQNQNSWQNQRSWRRGDRMTFDQQSRYRSVDYRRENLREPPRGYRYVQDDRGQTLLLAIASGVILSVILNQGGNY
jgi:Ni/Co efflux regulator RcnB